MGKRAYSKGSCRKVRKNPVRTKTWKLGEYGGNIKANVNESGTAVQIIHSDKPLKVGAYGRLFRWPLDKFELETKLNDLTTSYYASKIIEWVESVTKGTSMNPAQSFSDFREFLSETLIPDLRESGMDSTADDFETAVSYLTRGKDKKYQNWRKFIVGTLVPDLREAGYKATAKDFMTAVKFIDAGRRVVKNPPPLFSKDGYAVVTTYTDGEVDIGTPHSTKAQAEKAALYAQRMASAKSGRTPYKIEVLSVTSVAKNPPLSSHGSSIRTKRTHGLSLPEMRALYKLVKQGNDMAIAYARKKLEVPRSESKVQLLAVVDHHIRDLAGR